MQLGFHTEVNASHVTVEGLGVSIQHTIASAEKGRLQGLFPRVQFTHHPSAGLVTEGRKRVCVCVCVCVCECV